MHKEHLGPSPAKPTHDFLDFILVNYFVHLKTAPMGTLEHVIVRFDRLNAHVNQLHPVERRQEFHLHVRHDSPQPKGFCMVKATGGIVTPVIINQRRLPANNSLISSSVSFQQEMTTGKPF
jgi:hypothetical protein